MADLAGKPSSFYASTGGVPVNGAWYSGQQYWNGTLGAANVGNNPNQTDIYQKPISAEVVAQTNPANVQYLQSIGAEVPGAAPYSGGDVSSYLNNFQDSLFNTANTAGGGGVQTFSQIAADLKASGLFPNSAPPQPPSLVEQYKGLTEQAGVPAIRASITDLKAQQEAIAAQALVQKHAEQAKPVATNVIAGRISTEAQQAQEQYDFIGRQLSRKTDELNTALGNIKMIMEFTQTDYQNASAAYERQFSQAISLFNLIHGVQQDQKDDVQRAQDNARANAQIMINAAKATTSGSTSTGLPKPGSPASLSVAIGDMSTQIQSRLNSYGDISPNDWQTALNAWLAAGFPKADFIKNFGGYADTNRGDFESAYGFKL